MPENIAGMGSTLVPHRYPMWGTWGTYMFFTPFWGTSLFYHIIHAWKYCRRRSHFSTSPVPHVRYLRYIHVICLILRYIFQLTNEYAVLLYFTHKHYIGLYIFLCSIKEILISYLKYLPSILSLELPVFWSLVPNLGAPLKATKNVSTHIKHAWKYWGRERTFEVGKAKK